MQVPSTSLSKSNPLSDLAFDELLALADAAWAHSNAFLPGNDEGKTDQYPSILTSKSYCLDDKLTNPTNKLLSHHHLSSLEQHSIIHEHDNPQGTSCTTCCSITTSEVAPPILDNGIGAEKKPAEAMQMKIEQKYQGKKMINASAIRIDNNGTLHDKEAQHKRTQKPVSPKPAQSDNDQTEKRMYAGRKISLTIVTVESTKNMMPESANSCCNRSLNFDKGVSDESSADKENATVRPSREIGVVAPEMNAGNACELNGSMKQVSNYMSFPNDKQGPGTSSKSNLPVEKPKVIPAAKRKCVRKKGLNKNSTPLTEMTEELPEYAKMSCRRSLSPDIGARDESSAGRENGVIVQETNLGLAYDLNASVKHASNSFMSLPGGTQAPDISSQRTHPGTKPKENPTGKELKKTSAPPTKVTGEMTTEKMPEFSKPPCKSSMNFDKGEIEESSAVKENATIHLSKEIVVTQEMNPDLAYDVNSCMSLTEDTQATNTSSRRNPHGAKPKVSPTAKRKRSGLNKSPTPTEASGDLTAEMMPESAKTCWRRSLNFDKGAREESSADRENATVYLCKEIGLVMQEMDLGLAHDMNTSTGHAAANNYMSFPNEQTPSTSPSKNNPPGAKLNANSVEIKNKRKGLATALDGNVSNSQISTKGLQKVGYKRKDSGTIKCVDNSSVNLIGARNHGLPSYQSKFRMQFPNIQKKRRIEKGKTSNTHSTSSVASKKEVPLKCTQEDAQAHPYASNSNCWKYGGSAYNAVINNAQTFEEFISNLTRLTERSQLPAQTYDCNSLTRIRNSDDEPNYAAKKRSAKKKRNRKRSALSSSAHSNINETSKKEVPLKCTQEDAQAHPYASNSNCWKYGSSAYNAVINNAQTFEEFILTLQRLAESSESPAQTYDCNSLTRIRNSVDEPNYTAKKRSAKKKLNKKRSALSSSAHSNINEIQQHRNVALGNHHLPLGKSSDIMK